jgi:hypothetical protein
LTATAESVMNMQTAKVRALLSIIDNSIFKTRCETIPSGPFLHFHMPSPIYHHQRHQKQLKNVNRIALGAKVRERERERERVKKLFNIKELHLKCKPIVGTSKYGHNLVH